MSYIVETESFLSSKLGGDSGDGFLWMGIGMSDMLFVMMNKLLRCIRGFYRGGWGFGLGKGEKNSESKTSSHLPTREYKYN